MTFADKIQTSQAARHLSRHERSGRRGLSLRTRKTEEYERGYTAGRKSLQPQWVSTEDHQPGKDGIYFAVIESEDGSFSIGLYEMFAGGSWLIDRKRKVRYWAEQSSYDLPEELLRKGIACHVCRNM